MSKIVYRSTDYRNPHKYHQTYSRPSPLAVAVGLAAFTVGLAIACLLGLAAGF